MPKVKKHFKVHLSLENHRKTAAIYSSNRLLALWVRLGMTAVDHFAAASNYDLGVIVGFTLEAYRDLYRRMVALGDLPNAAKVLKELLAVAAKYHTTEDTGPEC